MAGLIPLLPSFDESEAALEGLPMVTPTFFIPRLSDKPQDPILDALRLAEEIKKSMGFHFKARQVEDHSTGLHECLPLPWGDADLELRSASLWEHAAITDGGDVRGKIRSWDSLHASHARALSSGFLSEQNNRTFAAARYYVNPRISDPDIDMTHVTKQQLLESLRLVMIGNSSCFYAWNEDLEQFGITSLTSGKRCVLSVDGRDEIITGSFVKRFLNIGTSLRRLDLLIAMLRRRIDDGPAIHAFTHAISSCVDEIRVRLTEFSRQLDGGDLHSPSSAIWMHLDGPEQQLAAVASLCSRDATFTPPYPEISAQATLLLSSVYAHLDSHISRGSPKEVLALVAHVLTTMSENYFEQLSQSVGYDSGLNLRGDLASPSHRDLYADTPLEASEEALDDAASDDTNVDSDAFPDFIQPEMTEAIIRAKRSLKLLHAAEPEHPLLTATRSSKKISWFWTSEEVEAVWNDHNMRVSHSKEPSLAKPKPTGPELHSINDVLAQFKIFDLEPGSTLRDLAGPGGTGSKLRSFMNNFPLTLPPLAPTLPLLTDVVLSPLVRHCQAISRSLLSVFLSHSSHLNVHAHLCLLRDFLLLTSPSFKLRLQAALFSDSEDWTFEGSSARAMAKRSRSRSRNRTSSGNGSNGAPWAVGLGLGVMERDSWPPGGADLSFYLRTVIVDSLESQRRPGSEDSSTQEGNDRVIAEAEFRLGFAIRDLPAGTGRERWLNPCSIESLDFLYMDYKPPHPLDIFVTPDVLSKYQRIFSFSLRLMRVQNALGALFRMTRKGAEPLFPTLAPSNKLLLHFRFVAQTFVTALSSYVFDTAIGGNFDAFLSRIHPTGDGNDDDNAEPETHYFSDVFALSDLHSSTLDDILSACLLRSVQRTAGELLRTCLELVLDLCILAGELKRERVEEYRAAPVLEDLLATFKHKMASFVKVLRAMVYKGSSTSHLPLEFAYLAKASPSAHKAASGVGSLHHLLVKLDGGGWYEGQPH
ncbi:hypothetical protein DENSPDRAFT_205654 [Dentipellis sp. KUC8613]|nr:hypothetical protein DENSPDRAFT_205654 [Dentipellis sp. KUC8613]